jgi:DNA-binding XRE family transcriptional regulator
MPVRILARSPREDYDPVEHSLVEDRPRLELVSRRHNGGPPLDDEASGDEAAVAHPLEIALVEEAKPELLLDTGSTGKAGEPSFGKLIRDIRQEAGLSQRELSDMSGVSRGALRKIESSDRDGHIRTIARLVSVMGYEIDLIAVTPLFPRRR